MLSFRIFTKLAPNNPNREVIIKPTTIATNPQIDALAVVFDASSAACLASSIDSFKSSLALSKLVRAVSICFCASSLAVFNSL